MLNFRKLKQDFASGIIKEGKELYEKQKVVSAKLLHLDAKVMRLSGRVQFRTNRRPFPLPLPIQMIAGNDTQIASIALHASDPFQLR